MISLNPCRLLSRSLILPLVLLGLAACSDGNDNRTSPAEALLLQFGSAALFFSEEGLQDLLELEDQSSPVVLIQLMSVSDSGNFARYEQETAPVWAQVGARELFASRVIGQILGERDMMEVRAIEFPNVPMLLDALGSEEFTLAMETLFIATSDNAWVLGMQQDIPLELSGGFFDPALQRLDRNEALALLAASNSGGSDPEGSLVGNPEPIIDMIVSDSPEPFHMINLIDHYEQANYGDGRQSGLTGEEANALYGQAILPQLLAHNSGPQILVPVSVVLTQEDRDWEQAVIVRYASRDAFLNIFALNPQAGEALQHKEAGVEETLVYVSEQRHASPPQPVDGVMFNLRYCEVLLPKLMSEGLTVEVWGTQGLNLCPQEQWDALSPPDLAQEFGAVAAFMNGPRYFVVDWISNTAGLAGGDPVLFGDIQMHLLTTVVPPEGAGKGETAYRISRVARSNVWHFVAGRRIYELEDPEGQRYIMQAFSRAVDADLQLSELATLGERLDLPEGWSFNSRVLTNSLELPAIDGTAEVLQDEFQNTYQRVP